MSRLKILMIVSSLNNTKCLYFPMDSPQEMINEIAEVSNTMKTILYKGIIETKQNKFTYQHYIPKNDDNEVEEIENQDRPVFFICSDKSCQDNKIEKVFKEIFDILNETNQKDSKITNETKTKIGKIFLKYQNINNIKESNTNDIKFGEIEELAGLDMKSRTNSTFFEISDTMNLNDPKKRSRLRNMENKKREEIENIKRWRKVKFFYLIISIILLMVTLLSIILLWNKTNN